MGFPISATLANIVMEHIEEIAITTAPHPPRWWFRFVDDSHTCLLKDYVSEFHDHLNSINPNVQFTVEKETESKLAFLDTMTTRDNTNTIQVSVYRKPTHTNKYLDFNSHHPTTHKRSVVNSLPNRADNIPTSTSGKRKERKHVFNVLMDNGYPKQFLKQCDKHRRLKEKQGPLDTDNSAVSQTKFITLPYIKGVSEQISRTLKRENLNVSYKPIDTLHKHFPKPKDRIDRDQTRSVVYSIDCQDCDFVYVGQTDRVLRFTIALFSLMTVNVIIMLVKTLLRL